MPTIPAMGDVDRKSSALVQPRQKKKVEKVRLYVKIKSQAL
jgi:hypothetical protein